MSLRWVAGRSSCASHTQPAWLHTPIRAPRANAHAERWAQTARVERLDWTLVLGRRHLRRVYVQHYNQQRPHRGLALRVPLPGEQRSTDGSVHLVGRRDVLGGLIHEYHAVAA
jgi:putative transposase